MNTVKAIESLLVKGMIQPGTMVGIVNPQSVKLYHRFLVSSISGSQITATHLASNKKVSLKLEDIAEIDGMSVSRYLSQADLDHSGQAISRGKKRGRRPKHSR